MVPGDGVISALELDGDLATTIQQAVRHFLDTGEADVTGEADRSAPSSESNFSSTPTPRNTIDENSHRAADTPTESVLTAPRRTSAHDHTDSSDSSEMCDAMCKSLVRGYFREKRKKFQQSDSSGSHDATQLPNVMPFPDFSGSMPPVFPSETSTISAPAATTSWPTNIPLCPMPPTVDPLTNAIYYYHMAEFFSGIMCRLDGSGSLQSLTYDSILHQMQNSVGRHEPSMHDPYSSLHFPDGTWESSAKVRENHVGENQLGDNDATEASKDFVEKLRQRSLPSALQDIESDSAKLYVSRLRAVIESFYRDRIEPTIEEVKNRLLQECKWSLEEVQSVLPCCAHRQDIFKIQPPRLGKLPVLYLTHQPSWFDGWIDDDTPCSYSSVVWKALTNFFNDHKVSFAGDVKGVALELRMHALPELSNYTLGELRHIVQIAIGEKLLTSVRRRLIPSHLALKKDLARVRKGTSMKTEACAIHQDRKPSMERPSTKLPITTSTGAGNRARSTSRRPALRKGPSAVKERASRTFSAPKDEAAIARALAVIASTQRGRSNTSGAVIESQESPPQVAMSDESEISQSQRACKRLGVAAETSRTYQ